ncbi:MAG: methyltransferase family protein [Rhabdaerophilum sp.]
MSAMEAVSYLLFVVYLVSFFGLTFAAARQAGKPVWLFGSRTSGQAFPAMLFRLGFAGAAIWPLIRAWIGEGYTDLFRAMLDGIAMDMVGHLLIAIGACIAAVSQMHMGASWRVGTAEGKTGDLVDDGPFAISRNPVFVGQIILFIGLFAVFPDIVQLGLTAAIILAAHLQVKIEERVFITSLGEPYQAYMARVNRWIGTR